jgi:iron complex transport system ATP-binding protein
MLDETFSGLDLHFQEECIRALKELSDSAQILVSHDLRSALRWAKQVWILHEGKWAYQGPIDEVRVPRALSEIYPGLMFHMRHDQIEWMRKT